MSSNLTNSHSFRTALLLLFGMTSAIAGNADHLLADRFNPSSRKARLEIATDMRNRVVDLLNYVPIPKPDEMEWVLSEKSEIDKIQDASAKNEREEKWSSTPEFQQAHLRSNLLEIVNALNEAMKPNISIRVEMFNWCKAAYGMTNNEDMNDSIRTLIQSGRLPSDLPVKVKLGQATGYTGVLRIWGRGIQERLLMPYLEGRIQK